MTYNQTPPPPATGRQTAHSLLLAATGSKRNQLIALLAVVLIVAAGGVLLYRHFGSSTPTGSELVLTAATDPGANAFMPPAASAPPTSTQPPPTLQSQGDGTAVETQPLPGDRDGLYGGTDNSAGVDPDKIADFLDANPVQAGGFVDVLNSDPTVYWTGGRRLTVADIPIYLHELTPAVLRLDTRITNHGFDGTHTTSLQSVFQRGTAVLLDAHGVPRVRGLSGNPLTTPIALRGAPKLVGAPWPGYHPGALAEVVATTAAITNFVLVDVVTGQPFNRPAGTTGASDTPHTEPIAAPEPALDTNAPTTKSHTLLDDIDGNYLFHPTLDICSGQDLLRFLPDFSAPVTHRGGTVTLLGATGTLNADGSFSLSTQYAKFRGAFATEDGRTVIRDFDENDNGICHRTYTVTKQ